MYVRDTPEASGGNRIETASQVAATLYRFGVTPQQCAELLAEWNENFCSPSLEADEIGKILDSAPRDRQQAIDPARPNAPAGIPAAAAWPKDAPAQLTARAANLNAATPITSRVPAPAVPAPYTSKLHAALDLARRGFRLLPLAHNTKVATLQKFTEYASRDEGILRGWFDKKHAPNIGMSTDDMLVADIDPRNGGDETLSLLLLTEEFPRTLGAETASGGCHMFIASRPE